MSTTELDQPHVSALQRVVNFIWPFVTGRRGFLIIAFVAIAGGLALNWGVVVAMGLAPLLLGVLPCVAMCALGMCMGKAGGGSCSSDNPKQGKPDDK